MLKPLLAPMAAAIALAVFVPMTAHAAPTPDDDVSGSHWYIGVSVGSGTSQSTATATWHSSYYPYQETISVTGTSNGAAFRLFGGWRYANSRGDSIGIGITDTGVSLGNSSAAGILGLDLNTKLHLVGPWFLSAKVGSYSGRNFNFSNEYGSGVTYSDAQDGVYYGIGTGIDLNDSNALSISWDRYQVKDYTDTSYSTPIQLSNVYLDVYLLSYTYTF